MALVTAGAVVSLEAVISLFDGVYATMAIPTMISTIILAPKVSEMAKGYFGRLDAGEFEEVAGTGASSAEEQITEG